MVFAEIDRTDKAKRYFAIVGGFDGKRDETECVFSRGSDV